MSVYSALRDDILAYDSTDNPTLVIFHLNTFRLFRRVHLSQAVDHWTNESTCCVESGDGCTRTSYNFRVSRLFLSNEISPSLRECQEFQIPTERVQPAVGDPDGQPDHLFTQFINSTPCSPSRNPVDGVPTKGTRSSKPYPSISLPFGSVTCTRACP